MTRAEALQAVHRIRAESAQFDMLDPDFARLLDAADELGKPSDSKWTSTGFTNAQGDPLYRCACCGRLTTKPRNANPSLCESACAQWTPVPGCLGVLDQ